VLPGSDHPDIPPDESPEESSAAPAGRASRPQSAGRPPRRPPSFRGTLTAPGSLGLAALPAIGLALLLLLPYLQKAFTIDDTLFLLQAQQALRDPLHPTAFVVVWSDVAARLSAIMPSGPIMAYLLMPTVAHGGAEWLGHLTQIALLCLGLLSTTALARRLGATWSEARIGALLTATAPAVLGMAGTVMPDIAAMTFGVIGIERYVAYLGRRGWLRATAAAIFLALAVLCRTHVLLLLAVAGLFAIEEELFPLFAPVASPGLPRFHQRLRELLSLDLLRKLVPIGLSLLLVGVGLRLTRDPLGGTGVVSSMRFFATLIRLPGNLLAFLCYLALTVPVVVPWAVLRRRHLSRRLVLWASLFSLPLFLLSRQPRCLPLAPLVGLSVACLVDLCRSLWQTRDARGVVLVAWLGMSLPVTFYIHFAPKYLVPSMPAIGLFIARWLCRRPGLLWGRSSAAPRPATVQRLLYGTLIGGAVLSLLILHADAGFADLGRRAAAEWIAPLRARGERVWFCGHWGFQWYALQAGGVPMTREPPLPQPGDIVVASQRSDCYHLPRYPQREPLGTLSDNSIGGRVVAPEVAAGFFSNGSGFLPWMVSWQPLDRYDIYRLTGPARPPLGSTPPLASLPGDLVPGARSAVSGDKRSVP
jgi:hypothetical protein